MGKPKSKFKPFFKLIRLFKTDCSFITSAFHKADPDGTESNTCFVPIGALVAEIRKI